MKLRLFVNMSYKYLILFVALIFLSGCVDQTPDVPEGEVIEAPTQEPTSGVTEVVVKMSNYKFEPNTINAKQGDKVKITVFNEEGTHNLFIEGYDEKTDIESSPDVQIIEFVADQPGNFEYWCKVSGHKAIGMKGVLIVE